jgi:Cu/Ag efflux protein CusF
MKLFQTFLVYSRMKPIFLIALSILSVFLVCSSCAKARGDDGDGSGANPSPTSQPVDKTAQVAGVDIATQQITLVTAPDHIKHVYHVDGGTLITVQGDAATLNDIHAGQKVASYQERDSASLDNIDLAAETIKSSSPADASPSANTPPVNPETTKPSDDNASPFGTSTPPSPSDTRPTSLTPLNTTIAVEGVDLTKQQITLLYTADSSKHVFLFDTATEVTVCGKAGTIKDLVLGQMVASYIERNSTTLASISVASP